MTLRDNIMDKYWTEFLDSKYFELTTKRYEHAQPLEATFWEWFNSKKFSAHKVVPLEEYLK